MPPANRPRLLDLYCCQGGASHGYTLAGFDVTGVDLSPQPRYPYPFRQSDALAFLRANHEHFDAFHASPPCQDHSTLAHVQGPHGTGYLLAETIHTLAHLAGDRPWTVENVDGASSRAVMPGAVTLCGRALGIPALRRHRLFVSNTPLTAPPCPSHPRGTVLGVYGHLRRSARRGADGRGTKAGLDQARTMFGMPWADGPGLAQAIPARYAEHIGTQLMGKLRSSS